MDIQEIKSEINHRPYRYDLEMAAALTRVIDFLENAAKHYNVPEGQRVIAAIKAIENCFVEN